MSLSKFRSFSELHLTKCELNALIEFINGAIILDPKSRLYSKLTNHYRTSDLNELHCLIESEFAEFMRKVKPIPESKPKSIALPLYASLALLALIIGAIICL